MSETARKMIGLALMAVSVFMIVFGLNCPLEGMDIVGPALAWTGVLAFMAGLVVHAARGS